MRRLVLLLPLAALAGCGLNDDGPTTSETRDVPAFTRIQTDSSVDLHLRAGRPQRVQVRAGEKVIGDVHTEVRDGTLVVTFKHHSTFGGPDSVEVDASVPQLTGVSTTGSGDVDARGVSGESFAVRSDGSGDIDVAGTARRLTVDLDGSGGADLAGLTAQVAQVNVGGSGGAEVRADAKLDVKLDGSGDVRYHGDPRLTQHVGGSGELKRAD
jgi:hypothetical protein